MPAAAAADMNAEFAGHRIKAPLQRSDDTCRDAGRMPIHAHDCTERLEPERVCHAAEQFVATVVNDDCLGDDRTEPCHALAQPSWDAATMKRKIGAAGSLDHAKLIKRFDTPRQRLSS